MKKSTAILISLFMALAFTSCNSNKPSKISNDMIIRLAEIQIEPEYLDAYLVMAKEVSEASLKLEPGVISIYPMSQKENPTELRILEIYANNDAYESHLQTSHFKHYKTATMNMVKSLKLVDMEALDKENMPQVFKKMK